MTSREIHDRLGQCKHATVQYHMSPLRIFCLGGSLLYAQLLRAFSSIAHHPRPRNAIWGASKSALCFSAQIIRPSITSSFIHGTRDRWRLAWHILGGACHATRNRAPQTASGCFRGWPARFLLAEWPIVSKGRPCRKRQVIILAGLSRATSSSWRAASAIWHVSPWNTIRIRPAVTYNRDSAVQTWPSTTHGKARSRTGWQCTHGAPTPVLVPGVQPKRIRATLSL